MKRIALLSTSLGVVLAWMAGGLPAEAAPQTWVSALGSGTTCTRSAPCFHFQVAHDATDPGGVIHCLDSTLSGNLTISKSITIDCTGTNGIMSGAGPLGPVTVRAGGGGVVLR